MSAKKLFIQTLGCAMNVRDSEHMIAELTQKENYALTEDIKEADLILINTCSVREKPVHKLFSEVGGFEKVKKEGAKIGVCGCTASHLGNEIFQTCSLCGFCSRGKKYFQNHSSYKNSKIYGGGHRL